MKTSVMKIDGMHCEGCSAIVRGLLQRHRGVRRAVTSFADREARILYDPGETDVDDLAAVVEKAGYRVIARDDP